LAFDIQKLSIGMGINPIHYNVVFRPMCDELVSLGLLKYPLMRKTFRSAVGLLTPLSKAFEKAKRRRRPPQGKPSK
jgi:hypothetical protein